MLDCGAGVACGAGVIGSAVVSSGAGSAGFINSAGVAGVGDTVTTRQSPCSSIATLLLP